MMEDETNSNSWLLNDNLLRLESWARDGLTDKQIAKNMNVSIQMFNDLKNNNKEISNALNNGRRLVDFEVENALLKRALGYKTTEVIINSDGEKKAIQREVPPDTAACVFWLKSRKKEKWDSQATLFEIKRD